MHQNRAGSNNAPDAPPVRDNPPSDGYNAPPRGVPSDVKQWFNIVDADKSGHINVQELQSALINANGRRFSETACLLMMGMFDNDNSGTIDVHEFQQLYTYVNQWISVFCTYDTDNSGYIEEQELSHAMKHIGFRFSPDFVKSLIYKSDFVGHRRITVDQFIVVCVQIQRLTEAFRQRDVNMNGVITIQFEDFISVALGCSV